MAKLQKQMTSFHDKIRLKGFEENQDLRDKKKVLLDALDANLNKDEKDPKLTNSAFNQGSYAMHTGVKPLHKADDYDIDIGIKFDLNADDHADYIDNPVSLKKRVKKALDIPQRTVNIKGPCVTVQYLKNDVNQYHVDLAIYKETERNSDHLDLARGKENSSEDNRSWDENDPKGLIQNINNRFPGEEKIEERKQMRRCARYLKRWRERQFSSGAPTSIALTSAGYHWFTPYIEYIIGGSRIPNDQIALRDLVSTILLQKSGDRIEIQLPAFPHADLLAGMTDIQMETFIKKLDELETALNESITLACPHEAAKKLQKQFGVEFDIPPKDDTGEKSQKRIVPVGASA
jgi:hypothetical protein